MVSDMSLGLVVLEENLFMRMCKRTPQSDDISQLTDKSADIKMVFNAFKLEL